MQRIMVFIDGNNFDSQINNIFAGESIRIDLKQLATYLAVEKCKGIMQRLYYYTAIGDSKKEPEKVRSTQQFIDTLNKKVDRCIAKPGYLKYLGKDQNGKDIYIEKGTDVNIAVDMVSLAYNNAYDTAILFSADTDYEPAIKMVRSLGKNVIVSIGEDQKAGYLKELCDQHIILTKEELKNLKR